MLSISRIRSRVREIESQDATWRAKARAMLRLRRRVRAGATQLSQIARSLFLRGDGGSACRFHNAARRLAELEAEIAVRVRRLLGGHPRLGGRETRT